MAIDTTLALSNLTTTSEGIDGVLLTWTNDTDGCLTYAGQNVVEVWRASTNDRSQASKLTEVEGNSYIDQGFTTRQTFYYWVRAKNASGELGPWEPSSSTGGVAGTPTTQDAGGVRNDLNVEDGATAGADFNSNLLNIPDRITNNATVGLNVTNTHLGYYDGSSWQVFIRDNGNFQFNGDGSNFIVWDGTALTIRGELNADDINAGTIDANLINAADELKVGNPPVSPSFGGVSVEQAIVIGNPSTVGSLDGDLSMEGSLRVDGITRANGGLDIDGNLSQGGGNINAGESLGNFASLTVGNTSNSTGGVLAFEVERSSSGVNTAASGGSLFVGTDSDFKFKYPNGIVKTISASDQVDATDGTGRVGSIVFARNNSGSSILYGNTVSGDQINASDTTALGTGPSFSSGSTWKCLGEVTDNSVTLFIRIS